MAGTFLGALSGGAIGGAVVNLSVNDTALKTGLASAETQTKTSTQKFGQFAALAWAAAGTAAIAFAADAVKAFREAEVVQTELERATGSLADEYTKLAEAQALHLGFSDEDIKQGIIILNNFKLTSSEVGRALPLLEDYARQTGSSIPDAAKVLGQALLGNTRGLKKLGIDFTATGNTGKDLNTILAELEDRVGGAAEAYGETAQGQVEKANQQWDEAKETLGSFVSDAVLPLIDAMPELVTLSRSIGEGVGAVVNPILEAQPAIEEVRRTIHQFAGMSGKELRNWGKDIADSFHDVVFDLANMKDHFEVTGRQFITSSKAMLGRARELSKAMKDISREKWINEDYVKFLSEQGPEWLVGFSRLNEQQQRAAQRRWQETTQESGKYKGSLDDITGALGKLGQKHANPTITFNYKTSGDPALLQFLDISKSNA